jgi:hypothetical protein
LLGGCPSAGTEKPELASTYQRRLLSGVGHFVPREVPATTAVAIDDFVMQIG